MDDSKSFETKCKILQNETLGRYVVAVGAIKEGETLLLEQPILIIPQSGEKRCSQCFHLTEKNCRSCHIFPLCDSCPQHNAQDCQTLAKISSNKTQQLAKLSPEIVGLLKALLLRENPNTEKYFQEMLELPAHLKERKDSEIWRETAKKIIQPLLKSGVLEAFRNPQELTETYLQQIASVLDVNIFEIRAPDQGSMRAFYLKASLLDHDCVSNTALAIDEQNRIKIFANRSIRAEEMITNCYTNVLLGTEERRQILQMGKCFHCVCSRCQDPTELGSHLSSFICAKCAAENREDGFIVKQGDHWKCLKCDHTLKKDYIDSLLDRVKEEMFHAQNDLYHYELLMAKLSKILHPNHYLMVDIKQNVASILRTVLQNMIQKPSRKVYERKIKLCQEVLSVLKIIQPGISRLKGIAIYEYASAFGEMQRMRFTKKEIEKNELINSLQQTEILLREAVRNLIYEPITTPEGVLTRSLLKDIKDLQTDLKELQGIQDKPQTGKLIAETIKESEEKEEEVETSDEDEEEDDEEEDSGEEDED